MGFKIRDFTFDIDVRQRRVYINQILYKLIELCNSQWTWKPHITHIHPIAHTFLYIYATPAVPCLPRCPMKMPVRQSYPKQTAPLVYNCSSLRRRHIQLEALDISSTGALSVSVVFAAQIAAQMLHRLPHFHFSQTFRKPCFPGRINCNIIL